MDLHAPRALRSRTDEGRGRPTSIGTPTRRLTHAMVRDLEPLLLPGAADLGAAHALLRECSVAVQRVAEGDQSRVDLDLFIRIRTWLRPEGSDVAYEVIDAWLCQARTLVSGDDPPPVQPHACRARNGRDRICGAPALPGSLYCPRHRLPALRRTIDVT